MAILSDAAARSPGLKFLLVALITIVMSVPLLFIFIALMDRQDYARTAESNVARGWGGAQTIGGPVLAVPYIVSESTRTAEGAVTVTDVRRLAVFLPKTLKADVSSQTQVRSYGIFDVNVYTADVMLQGSFAKPDFAEFGFTPKSIGWEQALLLVSASELQGLSENVSVNWGAPGSSVPFRPGLAPELGVSAPGINARVAVNNDGGEIPFDLTIKLRGTRDLQLSAAGGETSVTAKGNWPHPSFQGAFLPVDRSVSAQGFTARWQVPHLARNLPQAMPTADTVFAGLSGATFGIAFVEPVNFYLQVERALKYALLFIGLAFLSFFLIETLSGARLHGVQYLLIGGAQVVFYLLLLSFAEQWGFDLAYLAAAVATVGLISAYAWSALKSSSRALVVFAVLSVLYALLFLLLKQEDYALIIGASAAFAAVAVTMYVTRNVDWYQQTRPAVGFGRD
jgi:inner membrane protein